MTQMPFVQESDSAQHTKYPLYDVVGARKMLMIERTESIDVKSVGV